MLLNGSLFNAFFRCNATAQMVVQAETGRILEANDAARAYYGLATDDENDRYFYDFDTHHPGVTLAELNLAAQGIEQTINSTHRTALGLREVMIHTCAAGNGPETLILATIHDVTEQMLRERTVAADEERWRSALGGSGEGVWDWDITSDQVTCSPRWTEMLGYGPHELGSDIREWLRLVCNEERSQVTTAYEKMLAGGAPRLEMEYRMRRKDGSHVWVLDRCTVLRLDTDGRPGRIISVHSDITGRKRIEAKLRSFNESLEREVQERTAALNRELRMREETEQQLRAFQEQLAALTEELCLAEERERRRLAAWLHDDIGQNLALLKILIDRLRERSPEQRSQIGQLAELLAATIGEIRNRTIQISPPLLQKLGLTPSVAKLAADLGAAHGFSVSVEERSPLPQVPLSLRSTLFSIVKELLINIVKHADAQSVAIVIDRDDAGISIIVRDDGRGFAVETLDEAVYQNSFGLFHVRQRIGLLGGAFCVESAPAQGSCCSIRIPLQAHTGQ